MGLFGKKKRERSDAQMQVEAQMKQAEMQKNQQTQPAQPQAQPQTHAQPQQHVNISGAIYEGQTGVKIGGVGVLTIDGSGDVLAIFDNNNNYVGGIYKDKDYNDKASLLDAQHKRRAYYRGSSYNFTVLVDNNQSIPFANALFSLAFTIYTDVATFVDDKIFAEPVVAKFFSTFPEVTAWP